MIPNEQTVDEFNVNYWRSEFNKLLAEVKEPRTLARQLATKDDFFKTATGVSDVNNAKKDRAGLQATRRIVLALRMLLDESQQATERVEKLMRRQKLTRLP